MAWLKMAWLGWLSHFNRAVATINYSLLYLMSTGRWRRSGADPMNKLQAVPKSERIDLVPDSQFVDWFRLGWLQYPTILASPPMIPTPLGRPGYPSQIGAVSCFSLQPLPRSHYYTPPTNFWVKIFLGSLLQSLKLLPLPPRMCLSSLRRCNRWSFPSS